MIDAVLARDKFLRPFVRERRGLRVPGAIDPFEIGVRAIVGQQISVAAATRLAGTVVAAHGRAVPGLEALGLTHCFPSAATLATADLIGMPKARAAAIANFAEAVALEKVDLDAGGDLEEIVASLRAIPGIGEWTAQYVAMRGCGQRDAFPATDLGLTRALGDDPAVRARSWRPWRAYGALHVWTAESVFSQVRPDIPA